ncbi:MAG: hypothetical protein HY958_08700 [Bacteroidia bacterium]|nr:hypothetical protein [Bacteroidia bacterium]
MIYRFRIISDESDDFFCDIEIRSEHTFYDLHYALQYEAEWDSSQLASFYLTNENWERKQEISLIDIKGNTCLMDKTKISKFIKKEKQRLIYLFDILSDRAFYIELEKIRELEEDEDKKKFPVVVNGGGEFPSQLMTKRGKARIPRDIFDEEDFDDADSGRNPYDEGRDDE